MSGVNYLFDESRGVYIPKNFCEEMNLDKLDDIDRSDVEVCLAGPDHEDYWDSWNNILDNASHTDADGNVWLFMQDGGVFMYCLELMTEEEKEDLGMDGDLYD